MMKIIASSILVTLLCISAKASESTTSSSTETLKPQSVLPNINRGNYEVGGNFGLGYSTVGGFLLQLDPTFKYFILNHLSVGGTANMNASQAGTFLSAGPSVSYYFLNVGPWAYYLGEDLTYNFTGYSDYVGASTRWYSNTKLGFNYFFTPEVAFGPALIYSRPLESGYNGSVSLLATFGIFF